LTTILLPADNTRQAHKKLVLERWQSNVLIGILVFVVYAVLIGSWRGGRAMSHRRDYEEIPSQP
jgi:uncharacterized integral membrane protein